MTHVTIDDYKDKYPDVRPDFTVDQRWDQYTEEEHGVWRTLYERQEKLLPGRVTPEFLESLELLKLEKSGIPDFRRLSDDLEKLTGWRVVAVPGLVPEDVFFEHLANRRFVAGQFIRRPEQLDYLQEPDIFHDVFGHVPLLAHPVFADYMEAYGKGGLRALKFNTIENLARLYWYTVEFGLIRTEEGLRIYGSGIVSSHGETIYCLESPKPERVAFDLLRIMRTEYRIDDYQACYFVIDGFDRLFEATRPDFAPYYAELERRSDIAPGAVVPGDRRVARDTHGRCRT